MYVFDHVHLRVFLESNSFFIVENCIQLIHSQCNTTFFCRSLNWFELEPVFFLLACSFSVLAKQCKAKLNLPATILSLLLILQYLYISSHKYCTRSQHIVHYLIQLSMMYYKYTFSLWETF